MHSNVINFPRSSERRAHVTADIAKSGIDDEIVAGVNKHASCGTARARWPMCLAGERRGEEGR